MGPQPHPPHAFREIVGSDLRRAARRIIKKYAELDPQIRIATTEGDCAITMMLPGDDTEHEEAFRHLRTIIAWQVGNRVYLDLRADRTRRGLLCRRRPSAARNTPVLRVALYLQARHSSTRGAFDWPSRAVPHEQSVTSCPARLCETFKRFDRAQSLA